MTVMEYKEESNTDINHPLRKTKKGWDIIKSNKAEESSETNIKESKKFKKNSDKNEDQVQVAKKSSDTNRKESKKNTKKTYKNAGQPQVQVRKSQKGTDFRYFFEKSFFLLNSH